MNENTVNSYIVAFIGLLILLVVFRFSRKTHSESSAINPPITHKYALFLIFIFGAWSLIQWLFGFFLPLGWGQDSNPEIIFKDLHPEQFHRLMQISGFIFVVLVLAYFVLLYLDKKRSK